VEFFFVFYFYLFFGIITIDKNIYAKLTYKNMSTVNDILIFGMQGAGKGTQGEIIAKKLNLEIFETGGALRKIRAENSDLGRMVKDIMDRGDLVTNEIVMNIVEDFLEKNEGKRILFDGIPRMMEQKITFDTLLEKHGRTLQGIFLTLDEPEAISRMLERGRKDDTEEVIRRRLDNYAAETLPVIQEYISAGIITEVNGKGEINTIAKNIEKILS